MAQRLVPRPERSGSSGGAARPVPHPHCMAAGGWRNLMPALFAGDSSAASAAPCPRPTAV